MRPRIRPTAFYIIFTLCVVLAVNSADSTGQKVSAISNSLSNEGNSSGDLNKTGSSNNLFATGSSQTEAVSLSTLKQNPTSSNMNSLAPETTVATSTNSMKPSVPDSSQSPLTQKTTVQTTLPHVSGHYMPESSVTSTLGLRATESQISSTRQVSTSISTPILKPTQTESTGTSRQPTITDVTQPYTGSLYSILTTGTSGGSYNIPDDTLVISGGLYDESRVYNPNMTVLEEDDELHSEYPAFTSKYSQFRLEFLPEERELTSQGSSFSTFQAQS
ncbi:sialomucin core protein 24-like isoform X3 [Carcharodon carcharias]|uniref:sialomucin core protein 24-like isoform X3 n=1 Tax=Carcharodon carcharias TaxID=13397 RepID=UPI001B7ED987|nr:sialomucin core protein 24-like isoform X3 [Carcharodon carcharias]